MFELVKKLSETFGTSGNEDEIREVIKNEIKESVDEINEDTLGNLIATKRGNGKKIMIAAHMDEIGIMATYADDKGYIRFSSLGGVNPFYALSQKVIFKNGVTGVIHYEEKLDDMKNLKLSNMFVDIGAHSREEALEKVKIGETACFTGNATLQCGMISGKAMDDRAGCAVAIEVLKNLPEIENEVYFVFTVQEELGLRGARTAAYQIMPDIAIAIDVTLTGDIPECRLMEVSCCKGPAIKIKDRSIISHPEVKRLLEESARQAGIPFQYEILEHGGSDPGAIHLAGRGIPSGAVSIPCRYVHTPIETVSVDDLNNAVKLIIHSIKSYK